MFKECSVLLNRNFLDSLGSLRPGYLLDVEIKEEPDVYTGKTSIKSEKKKYFEDTANSCGTSENIKRMSKNCSILLNRNSVDSFRTVNINNYQGLEIKEEVLEASDGNNVGSRNSFGKTLQSEFCENKNSSKDEETMRKKVKQNKIHEVSKTEKLKKSDCVRCYGSFSSHSAYLIHRRSHLSKKFRCIFCNLGWEYRQSFITHMKTYHPEVEAFLCDYQCCEKSFKTQKLLERHKKGHLRYMCKFCKKLFATKFKMRRHVLKIH